MESYSTSSSYSTTHPIPGSFSSAQPDGPPTPQPPPREPPREPPPPPGDDSNRTCRICLESVPYPYAPSPELGRLISPCVCRGSSRYVHQGCLTLWRTQSASSTAYYQCPTCKYRYRFRRLGIAAFFSSTSLQFLLTSSILLTVVWALGFVSEPIVSLYFDMPDVEQIAGRRIERGGWVEHFLHGFASLGVFGVFKVIYALGPGSWWNIRTTMNSGRERAQRITWVLIAVGVINFFIWLWKKVGKYVKRVMEQAVQEVLEVGPEGDE